MMIINEENNFKTYDIIFEYSNNNYDSLEDYILDVTGLVSDEYNAEDVNVSYKANRHSLDELEDRIADFINENYADVAELYNVDIDIDDIGYGTLTINLTLDPTLENDNQLIDDLENIINHNGVEIIINGDLTYEWTGDDIDYNYKETDIDGTTTWDDFVFSEMRTVE